MVPDGEHRIHFDLVSIAFVDFSGPLSLLTTYSLTQSALRELLRAARKLPVQLDEEVRLRAELDRSEGYEVQRR